MKVPDQCESLQDVRTEIDRLDFNIIKLLAERSGYVKAAARFKRDLNAVCGSRAPQDNAGGSTAMGSRARP